MPELPEVETIRRNCEQALVGQRLERFRMTLPKLMRDSPLHDPDVLQGQVLVAARRRAKILMLDFANNLSVLIHFKLAGQWAIVVPNGDRLVAGHPVPDPEGPYPHKATHGTFEFNSGVVAYYSDIRQFGWFRILPTENVPDLIHGFSFGPEATHLAEHRAYLANVFGTRGIPIKTLLLDQHVIAGLGNIYVDEVLFRARVHPETPARLLGPRLRSRIVDSVQPVISEGIRQGGATIIHGRARPDREFPAVHGREGEPCYSCGTAVRKIRVGGRGTYYCPSCQRSRVGKQPAKASARATTGETRVYLRDGSPSQP